MGNDSHKISRIVRLFVAITILGVLSLSGCHDWPDERVTAIEAQNILRDLSRIETIPDPNMPRPEIYKSPPKKLKQIVGGTEEWKLVYFCQYHTAVEMKQIIFEQFAVKVFDEKGQSKTLPGYTVSANPATNQLIVRCPQEQDVDAVLEIIKETDIQPIQIRIDCMVSELYADMTMDRETTLMIEDLFGEGIALGGKVDAQKNPLPAFPGAALRDPARARFGLKVGIKRDDFQALVDILVSRGYLKILMNPSLEVLNGESAKIQSKQHVPLQQVVLRYGPTSDALFETRTEYYDVIDSLEITPHVFADGFIGMQTTAQISAYLTPEGIKQTPIVTERVITNKDNRIRLGESLIIGGIRKSEKRDVIRGVPILKDIPVLNLLFSGRDFEERATEVIFILTPSISTGGKRNEDMVKMMKDRHSSPMTQSLQDTVLDPLGTKARREEEERQLLKARMAQQESEAEMTAARLQAIQTGQQVEDLEAELEQNKARMAQLSTKAQQAEAQAQKATMEAQQARAELQKTKEKPEKPPETKPPAGNPKEQTPKPNEGKTDKPKEEAKPSGQTPPPSPEGAANTQTPKQK
jgi:Flp pilus assembly secretin CpaC/outer membrane murein-binding lipoprotein Lpp